jgi:hypothetical protein
MTLIEVCVALTLFALLAVSHTALTLRFAVRQRAVALGAYRSAALQAAVNTFISVPFDSLAVRTGCRTVAGSSLQYQQCVTLIAPTPSHATVQITITPSTLLKPDTLLIDRVKPAAAGAFGT